jgi:predicted lipoprotein with Yx(FWY)xxD motif
MRTSLLQSFFRGIFLLSSFFASAQWNSNPAINTPVCTSTGKQIDLRMMDDDHHGVYIAWKDYRPGLPDIYIQRIDSLGYPLWTSQGVVLCNDPADQSTPAITTDMKGGAIVTWSDWRTGIERDVFAQRISKNGVIKWTLNGVGVANKAEREHNEKIISDGVGGAIIVWEQQDNVTYWWDIWIQRIDSTGNPVWPVGGIPVSTVSNYRLNPKIQKDGKGGVFVTWQEWNADYDIFAQRIDKSGNRLWGGGGILLCNATGTQMNPKIDPDSITHGIVVAWQDQRSTIDYDIYAQRVDSMGNLLWTSSGKPVINFSGNQSAVDFLSNPKVGGSIFAWKDDRSGTNDIYAQRLDINGNQQWISSGVPICNAIKDQLNPNITGDGTGGAIIVWQDSSGVDWDIYSQRVDKNGNILWAANGVPVGIATNDQTSPKNVSDGYGGSIYAWQDKRSGTNDIYVHRISATGLSTGLNDLNALASAECFPNPFENKCTVRFDLRKEQTVSIKIFNVSGELIAEPVKEKTVSAGNNSVDIDLEPYQLPAGIYFAELKGNNFSQQIKLVKIK